VTRASSAARRRSKLDLILGKSLGITPTLRFTRSFALCNVLNDNAITSIHTTYGSQWLKPTKVLDARDAQVSARLDFRCGPETRISTA